MTVEQWKEHFNNNFGKNLTQMVEYCYKNPDIAQKILDDIEKEKNDDGREKTT